MDGESQVLHFDHLYQKFGLLDFVFLDLRLFLVDLREHVLAWRRLPVQKDQKLYNEPTEGVDGGQLLSW